MVLSLAPLGVSFPSGALHIDKVAHFMEYAVLSVLVMLGVYNTFAFSAAKKVLFALISCMVYGIVLELAQNLLPYRSAELGDAFANALGIIMGVITAKVIICRR